MKKIIIPIDFSDTSYNAFDFAAKLSEEFNADLEAFHVYKVTANSSGTSATISMYMDLARKNLNNFVAAKKKEIGQNIESDFLIGFPGDKILAHAKDYNDTNIVLGTHGEKDAIRNLFGSVSTKVGMNSDCPTWVIPPDAKFSKFKKIAFCTNDPLNDMGRSGILSTLANKYDSEVHLLNVFQFNKINTSDILDIWNTIIPKGKLKFETLYELDVVDALYEYCQNNDIDLIIINRKQRAFLSMLFNKSVTKKMIIKSDIPLLIMHR